MKIFGKLGYNGRNGDNSDTIEVFHPKQGLGEYELNFHDVLGMNSEREKEGLARLSDRGGLVATTLVKDKERWRVDLSNNLRDLGVEEQDKRDSYLEIATRSAYLRNQAKESAGEFKRIVDDYRDCDFDDGKIVDEFGFLSKAIYNGDSYTMAGVVGISALTWMASLAMSSMQKNYGFNIVPDSLLAEVGRGSLYLSILGSACFGVRSLINSVGDLEEDSDFIAKKNNIQKTAQVQRYLADPENNPRPWFLGENEDLAKYSIDRL